MSPRWKLLSKNGNSQKFGSRFGSNEKGNTPFFLMSNSGEKATYNWRYRPKTVSEGSEPAESVVEVMGADDAIEVEATKMEEDCEDQENVKPVDTNEMLDGDEGGNDDGDDGEGKWQKKVRHRRGRRKKKMVHVTLPVVA